MAVTSPYRLGLGYPIRRCFRLSSLTFADAGTVSWSALRAEWNAQID
jgi:hypothetical protein